MKKLLMIVSSVVLLVGITSCSSSSLSTPEGKEVLMLINKAEAARKIASKAGVEFRFTKKHIKNAQKALNNGNIKKAKALASKALIQAKRAVKQKRIQARKWKLAVPR